MTDVLIVIPAKGTSTGLPGKMLRPLGGVPVVLRAARTALRLTPPADVIVTTDDDAIGELVSKTLSYAEHGLPAIFEPPNVSGQRPLDFAVHWATTWAEQHGQSYEIVVTMQPTSPFTTSGLLQTCILGARQHQSAVTVREDRALRWSGPLGIRFATAAPARTVRQAMPSCWREFGAVLATQRRFVTPTSRFGETVELIEAKGAEAVDLDTPEDWAVAEWYAAHEQATAAVPA